MQSFDPERLCAVLKSLTVWKQTVFMAACCERMLPNYLSFNLETGQGDVDCLWIALNTVWDWIETDTIPNDVGSLIAACDQQAPETSKFVSLYTSAALDAANAIALTLEALGKPGEGRAVDVASPRVSPASSW